MRVLMIGPWQTTAMRRQIDWVVESGIEVCVVDFPIPSENPLPARFDLFDLLPQRVTTLHHYRAHKKSQRSMDSAVLRLQHLVTAFQPHIVHSYKLRRHTDLCLKAGIGPLVVSAWGYLNRLLINGPNRVDRLWIRRLRAGAHTLLVESPNLMDALAQIPLAPLQVDCFPLGVDGGLFQPENSDKTAAWRFALDIPAGAIVVLSPRGWSQTYGQQHIMRAFAEAYHRLDRPLVLVFMGMKRMKQPERLAQEALDLGVALGVGHAIRWIPEVAYDDMPGVYALADIVVNYPRSDAFPSTLLEAAACARPVITSDLRAYRNTFVERYCRLVEPENPAALADALVEMVGGGPLAWAANVHQARQSVLMEYGESAQKQRLIALYYQIAAERHQRGTKAY